MTTSEQRALSKRVMAMSGALNLSGLHKAPKARVQYTLRIVQRHHINSYSVKYSNSRTHFKIRPNRECATQQYGIVLVSAPFVTILTAPPTA